MDSDIPVSPEEALEEPVSDRVDTTSGFVVMLHTDIPMADIPMGFNVEVKIEPLEVVPTRDESQSEHQLRHSVLEQLQTQLRAVSQDWTAQLAIRLRRQLEQEYEAEEQRRRRTRSNLTEVVSDTWYVGIGPVEPTISTSATSNGLPNWVPSEERRDAAGVRPVTSENPTEE